MALETVALQDRISNSISTFIKDEGKFIGLLGILFIIASLVFPYPNIAMWVGFIFAGYSAIANDSIQTIGTFLASNQDKKWWILWLYIGGIFLIVVTVSWFLYDGDVSYQRLTSKGFAQAPTNFSFLQIAAPLFLLMLTRLKMPVSTTFLLLSCFASDATGITSVLSKSLQGYFIAFASGLIVWLVITKAVENKFKGKASKLWMPIQWITSGGLWAVWVMQDVANIAVYLPRSLSISGLLGFSIFIFLGLGVLFYMKGDKIQEIVTEKSNTTDIRSATIIDFIYALLLIYKLSISTVPMSTTWVFIGLLAGREIGMSIANRRRKGRSLKMVLKMAGRDAGFALFGLTVSIILALTINKDVGLEIFRSFGF